MTVDLSWMDVGDLTRTISNTQYRSGGAISISHFNGISRPVTAAGSISDGTTNFAPDAAISSLLIAERQNLLSH